MSPKKLYILLCFLVACSTKEAPKKKIVPPEIQTVVVKKDVKKKKKQYTNDTITTENCASFFKNYGKKNQMINKLLSILDEKENDIDAVALVPGPNFKHITGGQFFLMERPFLIIISKY